MGKSYSLKDREYCIWFVFISNVDILKQFRDTTSVLNKLWCLISYKSEMNFLLC